MPVFLYTFVSGCWPLTLRDRYATAGTSRCTLSPIAWYPDRLNAVTICACTPVCVCASAHMPARACMRVCLPMSLRACSGGCVLFPPACLRTFRYAFLNSCVGTCACACFDGWMVLRVGLVDQGDAKRRMSEFCDSLQRPFHPQYTPARPHARTHARIHAGMSARVRACLHTCTPAHLHACMHACMHARTHVFGHICVRPCASMF